MTFNGHNGDDVRAALLLVSEYAAAGKVFTIKEYKAPRTKQQNAYLWLLLRAWGAHFGYTTEEAETLYKELNADLYIHEEDIKGVRVRCIRHTYELDTKEMTDSIERFRNWSASNGLYLPEPNETLRMAALEEYVEQHRPYL